MMSNRSRIRVYRTARCFSMVVSMSRRISAPAIHPSAFPSFH